MKKILRNNLLGFILGIILCSGIVYGINLYKSEDIQYQPSDAGWEVSNVNDALNSLYNNNNVNVEYMEFSSTPYANTSGISFDITAIPNYGELVLWKNFFPIYLSGIDHGYSSDYKTVAGNTAQIMNYSYNSSTGILSVSVDSEHGYLIQYGTALVSRKLGIYYIQ